MLTDTCHRDSDVSENDSLDTHNTQELPNTDSSTSLQTAIGSASPPAKLELNS